MANRDLRIAIIGMSGEFPGAKNMSQLWQTLIDAKESITTLSDIELKDSGVSEDVSKKKNYVPRAASLDGIDLFAADFFGYSPREAAIIDPQQRKLLEHAWHACEDAAINPMHYEGLIGVFVGSSLNTYLMNNILSHPKIGESDDIQQILFGNGPDYLATRIAYQLNCRGPALNIQTACSTSLVAIHEACQQLLSYQVDVALAGGVSISATKTGVFVQCGWNTVTRRSLSAFLK
jgi:phthiocerol/phenolphthiocerol synthesis type-I polyketide synthase E